MTERFARIPERAVGRRDLTARDWRVLACIALHADASGRAYPSMATIAARTGLDRTKVPASVKKLETIGLLRASRRRDEAGDAASTLYEIVFDERGVLPPLGTPVAEDRNTVLPPAGTAGVAAGGTLTDQYGTDQRTRARRAARQRVPVSQIGAKEFEAFWKVYPSRYPHPNSRIQRGRPSWRQSSAASTPA